MADIVLTGDTSGSITVAAPAVAGTNTLTLPASTGTMITSATAAADVPKPTALSTATGSAPSYSARAWVNFNGTGTLSINDSANISSVADGGTGSYNINFTTAMPDENYTAAGICRQSSTGTDGMMRLSSIYTVNTIRVLCLQNITNTTIDCQKVTLTVFR